MRPTATAQSSTGDAFVVGQILTSNGMRMERYEADGNPALSPGGTPKRANSAGKTSRLSNVELVSPPKITAAIGA
jgi:hypothetical protein